MFDCRTRSFAHAGCRKFPGFQFVYNLAQADRSGVGDGDHDLPVSIQNAQHVKFLTAARDVFFFNTNDFRHPLSRIHGLVTDLELDVRSSLHSVSLQ